MCMADEAGLAGFLELVSQRQRDRFSGWGRYKRGRAIVGIIATATTSGLRDPVRHDQAADCADPGEEFSAPRDRTCSAVGGQGGDADPGGNFARHQHAAHATRGSAAEDPSQWCALST